MWHQLQLTITKTAAEDAGKGGAGAARQSWPLYSKEKALRTVLVLTVHLIKRMLKDKFIAKNIEIEQEGV